MTSSLRFKVTFSPFYSGFELSKDKKGTSRIFSTAALLSETTVGSFWPVPALCARETLVLCTLSLEQVGLVSNSLPDLAIQEHRKERNRIDLCHNPHQDFYDLLIAI
jgi:hypothetical protein